MRCHTKIFVTDWIDTESKSRYFFLTIPISLVQRYLGTSLNFYNTLVQTGLFIQGPVLFVVFSLLYSQNFWLLFFICLSRVNFYLVFVLLKNFSFLFLVISVHGTSLSSLPSSLKSLHLVSFYTLYEIIDFLVLVSQNVSCLDTSPFLLPLHRIYAFSFLFF